MVNGLFERETILEIKERIDMENYISTRLELEVEYYLVEDSEGHKYRRRKNSRRTIIVEKLVDGVGDLEHYEAEGFVDSSRLMDVHTTSFLLHWSKDKETKINFIGNSL